MASFGKRNPAAANDAFREKTIALADKVGLRTGGPDGLLRSKADHKERVARAHADLQRRTREVHDILAPLVGPDCQMVPFFLIPESCWTGETGQYLMEFLGLAPTARGTPRSCPETHGRPRLWARRSIPERKLKTLPRR